MAVVFRAKLLGPGGFEKILCLKQIRAELAAKREFIDLFVAEAKLTVSLTHANIVPVYELGMVEGTYFLALELIDGPPLSALIAEGPAPAPLAAYVVEQVLRGLDYAHRRGVVHRDLSPANVLVSRDGEVKIVDFGIAATASANAVHGGSRGYMAPEQEAGAHADARSDLYAVGVLLWELCSGKKFDGGAGDLPEALAAIVEKATARLPDARYPDAASMLAQVARYLREVDGPTQVELSEFVRRRCPDVAVAKAARTDVDAPDEEQPGPRTVPVAGRSKQVTFATRIQSVAKPQAGSAVVAAVSLVAGLGAMGALAAFKAPTPPAAAARAPIGVQNSQSQNSQSQNSSSQNSQSQNSQTQNSQSQNSLAANSPMGKALHLVVKSTPPGAEVRVGERAIGFTPVEVDLPQAGAPLHLRKRGFQPVDRPLDAAQFVGAPPTATVNERLTPLGRGTLTLGALPWAHVTIDGEKRPDTPLVGLQLPAGPHQVQLVCPPTGREFKLTVVIEADTEARRVVDLRGEPHLVQ